MCFGHFMSHKNEGIFSVFSINANEIVLVLVTITTLQYLFKNDHLHLNMFSRSQSQGFSHSSMFL